MNYESLVCDVNTVGTAATMYSGSRSVVADSFTGGFRLREVRNGVNIQTFDINEGTNYSGAVDFVDNNNNWTIAEHNNAQQDQAALDAHWGSEMVLDYFRINHNRNSIDDNGLRIINYVHYSNGWPNAQWDSGNEVMRYGDGDVDYSPLTSLDIIAHEIGHGIDQHTSDLIYQNQSGAIDESLSDIWGAVVEFWTDPSKSTWEIGEEIGGPLRSMNNPSSLTYNLTGTTSPYPDTYSGTGYYTGSLDNGGVHINSSVMNFWFFLLSEGGTGTNDNGDCYSINGIGINDAADIVYRAEVNYLVSSSTFVNARNAMIQSAIDLFGANSPQVASTTNAWYAVGVGNRYVNPVNGSDFLCSSNFYSLINIPAGTSVSWSVSPTYLFSGGTSGSGATANLSPSSTLSSGQATLTYTIGTGCNSYTVQRQFWVGRVTPYIVGPYEMAYNTVENFYVEGAPHMGITGYNWSVYPSGFEWIGNQGTNGITLTINTPGEYSLSVDLTNPCGVRGNEIPVYVYDPWSMFMIYPNPASDIMTISKKSTLSSKQVDTTPFEISLYDNRGRQLVAPRPGSEQVQLDVSNLKNGFYFVHILYKGKLIRNQIKVER